MTPEFSDKPEQNKSFKKLLDWTTTFKISGQSKPGHSPKQETKP